MPRDVTDTTWRRIDELFSAAVERQGAERAAFIAQSCNGDESLRRELESLLCAHEASADFMRSSMFNDAVDLIAEDEEQADLPKEIGPYKIDKQIGRGGMGAVYLAVRDDGDYRRQVALKVVKRGMDTDFILNRFRAERKLLAGFDHPNIARLWDGGATEDGLPYFAMEYVEGLPIDNYCDTHRLSIAERLNLFRHVCSAVQYAHQRLIVHRDLKPGNILVTVEGVPKLLDFGIAKLLSADGDTATMTALPLRVMTPEYASPEQICGQTVTTATDVYSLGVILYELLSGHPPHEFPSRAPDEIAQVISKSESEKPSTVIARVQKITTGRFAGRTLSPQTVSATREGDPEKLRKRLRGDLDNIVLMAMRADPARRYGSVAEFSEDIRRHLDGLPVIARRDTFSYRAGKFVRRNRIAIGIAALALSLLTAGCIAIAWEAHIARVARKIAEQRLNDVRNLVHNVLFDYHDAIKELRGSSSVRQRLVRDALAYLASVAEQTRTDASSQRELAAAYERVGDIQGASANAGDITQAVEQYRQAAHLREALLAARSADKHLQVELASSYKNLGRLLWWSGNTAAGLETAQKALGLRERLIANDANDTKSRLELALINSDIAEMQEEQAHLEIAREKFRTAKSIAQSLAATEPANDEYRAAIAYIDVRLGDLQLYNAETADALDALREAVSLDEDLARSHPDNPKYKHNEGLAYERIGMAQEQSGNAAEAVHSYIEQLKIWDRESAADPIDRSKRAQLANALVNLGTVEAKLGKTTDGLPRILNAVAILDEVVASDAANAWERSWWMQSCARAARLLAQTGDKAGARAKCGKLAAELTESRSIDETNLGQARFRAFACEDIAGVHSIFASDPAVPIAKRRLDWSVARDLYQRSLSVWTSMQNRHVLCRLDEYKPQEVAQQIARCDAALAALGRGD